MTTHIDLRDGTVTELRGEFFKHWSDLVWYVVHEMDYLVVEVVSERRGRFVDFEARENDGGVIQARCVLESSVWLGSYEQLLLEACLREAVRPGSGCKACN